MKVFWSWQSDTPGKIGRHLVRDALREAIALLNEPEEIEEPHREEIELDQDRQGVPGSPDLANLIFKKIESAAVFVADVTLVGKLSTDEQEKPKKRFINSNVAIEYGHAHHALGDFRILMVQNTHYGDRDMLPFDMAHKGGPIQFLLAPDADAAAITQARSGLKGKLVFALREMLNAVSVPTVFEETKPGFSLATFAGPGDVLARRSIIADEPTEFYFRTPIALYARLIPSKPLRQPLKNAAMKSLVEQRGLDIPIRHGVNSAFDDRNGYGAISFYPTNNSSQLLRAFSQIFKNGEIWCASDEMFLTYDEKQVIPEKNVENIFTRVLTNFCKVAAGNGVEPSFTIEIGGTGLSGHYMIVGRWDTYGPIHDDSVKIRRPISGTSASIGALVNEFLFQLFDVAGYDRAEIQPESL